MNKKYTLQDLYNAYNEGILDGGNNGFYDDIFPENELNKPNYKRFKEHLFIRSVDYNNNDFKSLKDEQTN